MRFHFLTGLPRSGSTLLASILSQNPRFHASIQSPMGQVFTDALTAMGSRNESERFITNAQREHMLRGIVEGYYQEMEGDKEVVFDNNRRWSANVGAVQACYPDSLFIACVRDPRAIVDSFERLFQKYPLSMSVIFGGMANMSVAARVHELMKPGGVLGFSLDALRSAVYGPYNSRVLMIEYDNLARFPAAVVTDIYNCLGEAQFNHNFEDIDPIEGAAEFDKDVATPGLHDLKPIVVYEERKTILPPEIFNALPGPFWRANGPVTPAQ